VFYAGVPPGKEQFLLIFCFLSCMGENQHISILNHGEVVVKAE
jgi:hypothetical protein